MGAYNPVIDFYSESNQDGQELIDSNAVNNSGIGGGFYGNGVKVISATFYLKKVGSPAGTANAKIYAATGTPGSSEAVTGSALATSDNLTVSTLTTSFALVTITFSGANQITPTAGTRYILGLEYSSGSSGNSVIIGVDTTSYTAFGNLCYKDGSHTTFNGVLTTEFMAFYLNGASPGNDGLYTNLYAYYKLEEASGKDALDVAQGRHCLQNGGTVGTGTGIIGNGRTFPGTAGITLFRKQEHTAFSPASNHFSFSCWVNQAGSSTGDKGIIGKYNSGGNREWLLYISNSDTKFHLDVSANGSTATGATWTSTVSTSTWYHVCGGWDGSQVWIVVNNGTRVNSTSFTGPVNATTIEFMNIGQESGGGAINGTIDEYGFWMGRDLSTGEISQLYNSGAGLAYSSFGVSGSTGDLSVTLGALTLSGAGAIAIQGVSTVTLGAVTLSSGGAVAIQATMTKTLAALTLVSAGGIAIQGTMAQTLATEILSGAGTILIQGNSSVVLGALIVLASGGSGVAVNGDLSVTLSSITLTSGFNYSTYNMYEEIELGPIPVTKVDDYSEFQKNDGIGLRIVTQTENTAARNSHRSLIKVYNPPPKKVT